MNGGNKGEIRVRDEIDVMRLQLDLCRVLFRSMDDRVPVLEDMEIDKLQLHPTLSS